MTVTRLSDQRMARGLLLEATEEVRATLAEVHRALDAEVVCSS